MMSNFPEKHVIVLIEDDEGHATLIQKNLKRAGVTNRIIHLHDGAEALHYFFSPEMVAAPHEKTLILLDLNLPEIDGYEILRRLKGEERTRTIPVIMLTTADTPREIDRCYQLGCNVYVTKNVEYDDFTDTIHRLGHMLTAFKVPHGYR